MIFCVELVRYMCLLLFNSQNADLDAQVKSNTILVRDVTEATASTSHADASAQKRKPSASLSVDAPATKTMRMTSPAAEDDVRADIGTIQTSLRGR